MNQEHHTNKIASCSHYHKQNPTHIRCFS